MDVKSIDKKYVASTYARADVTFVSGQGSILVDDNGKEYIDLGSGIAVNTFGHNDQEWKDAVTAQINKIAHTSNLYYSEPCALLAQKLCERTGMSKVFFSNSGAEANECAIKCARKYSFDRYGKGRGTVITLKNSFHGRTLATLTATGQDVFHDYFHPFPTGFDYASATDFEELKAKCDDSVCAIMMELVQGEGGVQALDKEFVLAVEKLCRERDILLVIDEVQTGNGRTGDLYAYQGYGIKPDIVSTAKGLAGGLPLGATMMASSCADTLQAGSHGSTFGGNPVACAGAISVLDRITDELLDGVKRKSEKIVNELKKCKKIASVSGKGFMLGIEVKDVTAGEVVKELREKGVIALTAKTKVRLLPALNISDELLDKSIEIMKGVLN